MANSVLFWMFIGGLAWCPYSYAGSGYFAWGVNAALFPGLAVLYEISVLATGQYHPVPVKSIGISAALFVAVVTWIVFQDATWVPTSWHHPIWAMTADTLGRPVNGSVSVNRDLTTLALMRLITAASVFWLALQLCRKAARAQHLLIAIAVISCGYAAYGLIFNQPKTGLVTSTFGNRNHYATYAGIGLVTICGLILEFYRDEVASLSGSFRYGIARIIEVTGQRGAAWISLGFLVFVALLLTGSRGGIIATGFALMVLGMLWFARHATRFHQESGATTMKARLVSLAILAIFAFGAAIILIFGDKFFHSLAERGATDENRAAVYVMTLRSIFDAPLLGYGYGTFMDVFPMFRDRSISVDGRWEQAHNTYLEAFQGLGLIFGSLLVISIGLLIVTCCKGVITRRQDEVVPAVAVSVACLVGVHALVDFSLQLQSVALTFAAVLGAGVAQSRSTGQPNEVTV